MTKYTVSHVPAKDTEGLLMWFPGGYRTVHQVSHCAENPDTRVHLASWKPLPCLAACLPREAPCMVRLET